MTTQTVTPPQTDDNLDERQTSTEPFSVNIAGIIRRVWMMAADDAAIPGAAIDGDLLSWPLTIQELQGGRVVCSRIWGAMCCAGCGG